VSILVGGEYTRLRVFGDINWHDSGPKLVRRCRVHTRDHFRKVPGGYVEVIRLMYYASSAAHLYFPFLSISTHLFHLFS
jgi:hypothetical protein